MMQAAGGIDKAFRLVTDEAADAHRHAAIGAENLGDPAKLFEVLGRHTRAGIAEVRSAGEPTKAAAEDPASNRCEATRFRKLRPCLPPLSCLQMWGEHRVLPKPPPRNNRDERSYPARLTTQRIRTRQAASKSSIRMASRALWLPCGLRTKSRQDEMPLAAKAAASWPPPEDKMLEADARGLGRRRHLGLQGGVQQAGGTARFLRRSRNGRRATPRSPPTRRNSVSCSTSTVFTPLAAHIELKMGLAGIIVKPASGAVAGRRRCRQRAPRRSISAQAASRR